MKFGRWTTEEINRVNMIRSLLVKMAFGLLKYGAVLQGEEKEPVRKMKG